MIKLSNKQHYLLERALAYDNRGLCIDLGSINLNLILTIEVLKVKLVVYDINTGNCFETDLNFLDRNKDEFISYRKNCNIIIACDREVYEMLNLLNYRGTQTCPLPTSIENNPYRYNVLGDDFYLHHGIHTNKSMYERFGHDDSYFSIIDYLFTAIERNETHKYMFKNNSLFVNFFTEHVIVSYKFEISDIGKFSKYITYLGVSHFVYDRPRLARRY